MGFEPKGDNLLTSWQTFQNLEEVLTHHSFSRDGFLLFLTQLRVELTGLFKVGSHDVRFLDAAKSVSQGHISLSYPETQLPSTG